MEDTEENLPSAPDWFDGDDTDNGFAIREYEVSAAPNDFNLLTLVNFIASKAIKIPGFQRNYVWDIKRASKLIESIIIGLPIPQIFLYEESKNNFLVIDGQQRLMSIYYFWKQRFPRKEKRVELRQIFDQHGDFPMEVLADDRYFTRFNLKLPESLPGHPNKFHNLNYETLGEYQTTFNLRTIRNVIIKQTAPEEDDSAMFEIFNRLNSGGINLKPQEIRTSMYHSAFYDMLYRFNIKPEWRSLLDLKVPDLNMKDIEFLLRGFAMLCDGSNYAPSMIKFLNRFSKKMKQASSETIEYLENLAGSFVDACDELPAKAFYTNTGRFNISIFESVFFAVCETPFQEQKLVAEKVKFDWINELKSDPEFLEAAQKNTASTANVEKRLTLARSKYENQQ